MTVRIAAVTATMFGGTDRKAVSYSCPACNAVLGVEIDPIALRTEIVSQTVDGVVRALGKR
jgi:hypothetical protein